MPQILGVLRGVNHSTQQFVCSILEDQTFRIGRSIDSSICIDLEVISEQHCFITSITDQHNVYNVYLTDISEHGTFLNGSIIGRNKTVLLYTGCLISFVSPHINLVYIQNNNDDEEPTEFTKRFQPGYLSNFNLQLDKKKEVVIRTTSKAVGYGAQASIIFGFSTSNPTRQLACKYYRTNESRYQSPSLDSFNREVAILKSNNHPNVLSLVACHQDNQGIFSYVPFYPGGTLSDRFQYNSRNGILMGDRNAVFLMQQLLSGLEYLHDKDIIHCDIKPENILISERHLKRPRLIIADFGLSIQKSDEPTYWRSDYGTASYHSPEMIRLELYDERVDSWAAGILFYYMLTNQHPFAVEADSMFADEDAILNKDPEIGDKFRDVTPLSKELVKNLLEKDQTKRITAKQANRSRWVFTYWNNDKIDVQDAYLSERQYWFGEEPSVVSVSTPPLTKSHSDAFLLVDDPENVAFIIQHRNPYRDDTFLHGEQSVFDLDLHKDFIDKINRYKHPLNQLASFLSEDPQ